MSNNTETGNVRKSAIDKMEIGIFRQALNARDFTDEEIDFFVRAIRKGVQ